MQKRHNDKKRILFLARQYAPIPKVCEICVKRVRKSLYEKGIESDVLQFTGTEGIIEKTKYGNVYSIGAGTGLLDTTAKNKLRLFLKRAAVAHRFPFYYGYQLNNKYREKISELNASIQYDAIIGVSLPVDTAYAGIGFKRYIFYELDAITNTPQNTGRIKSLYRKRIEKIEKEVFDNSSLIIHMEFNRSYFQNRKYASYRNKSVFADIPNLTEFPRKNFDRGSNKFLFAYFGTLIRDIRSPEYLIRLIAATYSETNGRYMFYSRGNCEDILRESALRYPEVIYQMGYISSDEVVEIQNKADFLLSIGNKLTGDDRSLPSKILEYIAIGKPIIHIHGGDNDSAVEYLEKYGLACIINPEDDFNINVKKYLDFICVNAGKTVSYKAAKEMFPKNTPEYTADIIYNFIQKTEEPFDDNNRSLRSEIDK